MTGRERLRAAYRGQKVDRLPWAPIVDAGTLRDYPPAVRERGPHRFVAELGGDVLCRSCALFKTECAEVEVSVRMVGDERVVEHRTSVGMLREVLRLSSSGQWRYVQHLLNTPEDCRVFRFMLEHTRITADYSAFDRVSAEVGEHGIIAPHCAATPVQELLQIRLGVDRFAYALEDYRAEVEDLMALMHRKNLERYEIVAASPVDVAILCENTSTRMISPAIYERYSLGHVRDFVEVMHRRGKVAIVHMCGHVKDLLPLIAQTGLDGVDTLTPPPTGNTTPHDAWRVIGDHLVIHGVWNPQHWLTCSEEELEGNLLRTLDGLRGRRFILCTPADGLPGIRRQRFQAVARLILKYGAPW